MAGAGQDLVALIPLITTATTTTICRDTHRGYYKAGMFCAGTKYQTPCDRGAGAIIPGQPPRVVGTFVQWGGRCDKPGLFTMDISWLKTR